MNYKPVELKIMYWHELSCTNTQPTSWCPHQQHNYFDQTFINFKVTNMNVFCVDNGRGKRRYPVCFPDQQLMDGVCLWYR